MYLEGKPFLIRTDHAPLQYILNPRSKLTPRQIRWPADLRQFQFRVEHVKGKEYVVPDVLSRLEGKPHKKDSVAEMIECFPALCSIQVHAIQTCRPAHIVRIHKPIGEDRSGVRKEKHVKQRGYVFILTLMCPA